MAGTNTRMYYKIVKCGVETKSFSSGCCTRKVKSIRIMGVVELGGIRKTDYSLLNCPTDSYCPAYALDLFTLLLSESNSNYHMKSNQIPDW